MFNFGWRFARCSSPSSGPVARILEHLATNEQGHSQTGLKLEQIKLSETRIVELHSDSPQKKIFQSNWFELQAAASTQTNGQQSGEKKSSKIRKILKWNRIFDRIIIRKILFLASTYVAGPSHLTALLHIFPPLFERVAKHIPVDELKFEQLPTVFDVGLFFS